MSRAWSQVRTGELYKEAEARKIYPGEIPICAPLVIDANLPAGYRIKPEYYQRVIKRWPNSGTFEDHVKELGGICITESMDDIIRQYRPRENDFNNIMGPNLIERLREIRVQKSGLAVKIIEKNGKTSNRHVKLLTLGKKEDILYAWDVISAFGNSIRYTPFEVSPYDAFELFRCQVNWADIFTFHIFLGRSTWIEREPDPEKDDNEFVIYTGSWYA